MSDVFSILQSVADATGKNDKREILNNNNTNTELAELLDAALNFKRVSLLKSSICHNL